MDYRPLGASGLMVSPICLGTMMFGKATDEDEAAAIVDAAFDAGINFIDTGATYADGLGEEIVGRLVAPHRDHWVVATKVGPPFGPGPNERGTGRRHVRMSMDRSLRRLRTDRVDVYYLHLDDLVTPLEESVRAMGDVVHQGKALYWGVSNFRGWRLAEAVGIARDLGVPPPIVVQPYYHALNRRPEVELLPAAAHHGLGVVPYSPIARGMLTGKYRPGEPPPEGSRAARADKEIMGREWRDDSMVIAAAMAERARARGMSPVQFAVNWLLANRHITSILAGPRTLEQWREYAGVFDHGFDAEDAAFVDGLVPPGSASTHGWHDPEYPLTGRPHRDLAAGR
jgi:aryl-alcohol dehydrogenase-like predicted oxidoreductase